MSLNSDFLMALNQIEAEKGISKEVLLQAICDALLSAYKKDRGSSQNVRVEVDSKDGRVKVLAKKDVVETVVDERNQIHIEEARLKDVRYKLGDAMEIEVTPRNFGRIAAQTAKQVVIQRIREAERGLVYDKFKNREGDVITGVIQRRENRNVFIDLGDTEGILAVNEQVNTERYELGDRMKVYILSVKKANKGPQVFVSRTHPVFLKRLLELEVPEIHDGIVEIKALVREAGSRSKVAVASQLSEVDAIGACVGPRGSRIQAVVNELNGEKVDIIEWKKDIGEFIANALSPAKVLNVKLEEAKRHATVVVPDDQLSLAIGKEGQNARLAAKLTGWKIDIKCESLVGDDQQSPGADEEKGCEAHEQGQESSHEDVHRVSSDQA